MFSVVTPTGNIRPKLDGSCGSCARRRAQASIAHIAGESTGATGLSEANGFRPTDVRTFDTTSVTTFGGADGSLIAFANACVSGASATAEAMPATDSTAASVAVSGSAVDAGVAAALTITVDCWFAEVELADPVRFVRCAAGGIRCRMRISVRRIRVSPAWCDGPAAGWRAPRAGCGAGAAAARRATRGRLLRGRRGSLVARRAKPRRRRRAPRFALGVASADAVVSLLDGAEPVSAPPELCTIPERGSAVEASTW